MFPAVDFMARYNRMLASSTGLWAKSFLVQRSKKQRI
jgi:hypothetical protein